MPTLRILEGHGAGTEVSLTQPETIIGRDKSVDIALLDTMVSRMHSKIVLEGSTATIIDLESRNGTFVNRLPIDRHQLVDGDEISIGESIFIFQEELTETGFKTEELQTAESANYDEKLTVEIADVQSAIQLQEMGRSFESLPQDQRDLAILYEVGRTINSTLKLDEILGHVLEMIFQTMPVERGVVLLVDQNTGQLKPKVVRHRDEAKTKDLKVSETIVNYALERGLGISSKDALADERFSDSQSIETQVVRSMLCVPLKAKDEVVGVVYVDSTEKSALDQKHLLLLQAVANQAAIAIENARLVDQLRLENRALRRQISRGHHIVGGSEQMREIYDVVRRVAPTDATVLLRGESGVGKEVIARAIHEQSKRRAQPIMCVNCAALSPTLLEAELFGYERGAFTGATERRAGRFEVVSGSTLFLDEIGDIPPELQAKLLRVLQEREFERVGGTETLKVDVRIITSTNRDLEKALEDGVFREDLYYRLKVIEIMIPPLRERKEDIPALVEQFLKIFANEMGVPPPDVSSEALAALMNYDWPGNVRELKNLTERAVVLGIGEEFLPEHLPGSLLRAVGQTPTGPETGVLAKSDIAESLSLAASEKKHIGRILQVCQWNKSRAAELLEISRPRLDRKIKEYGLQKPAQ